MLTIGTRQAYSELDSFLELLNEEDKNKIPKRLREYFKREKDLNYQKEIKTDVPIKEQNFKKETLDLIAFLDMQYWSDEARKQELKEYYKGKEEQQKIVMQEQLNHFHASLKEEELSPQQTKNETINLPNTQESWWKRLIHKIKQVLKK